MIGYPITLLVVGVPTLFALVAPRSTPLLAQLSFWLGLGINEIPLSAAAVLVILPSIDFASDHTREPAGQALLGVGGVIFAGLVVLFVRGFTARPALETAFEAARLPVPEELRRRHVGRTIVSVLAPWAMRRRGVQRQRDIRYGPHGRRNRLDVLAAPTRTDGRAPVLLYWHGGGYFSGRKWWESRWMLTRMAAAGWVCVTANYRLRPHADWEEHLHDASAALDWVRAHIAEFGGDPERVVLSGSSAGGHLSSILALRDGRDDQRRVIRGVVSLYGYLGRYYGRRPGQEPISDPTELVRPDAPPFLIVHGRLDSYVPIGIHRRFTSALRAAGAPTVASAELPGAQHSFDLFRSPRWDSVVDAVEAFTAHAVARQNASGKAEGRSPS